MEDDHGPIWRELNALRDQHADLRRDNAVLTTLLGTLTTTMCEVRDEVKALRTEMSERRGATKITAWIVGALIALGIPAAYLAHIGGQR